MKLVRKFSKKATDEFVTCYDSLFDDSLVAMAKCLAASAKERITTEINDYYPNAEIIAREGKFLADAVNLMDVIGDYVKASGPFGDDELFEECKKHLKEASQFIREDAGDEAHFRTMLIDMFSECEYRKDCITDIVELIYG